MKNKFCLKFLTLKICFTLGRKPKLKFYLKSQVFRLGHLNECDFHDNFITCLAS